MPPSDRRTSIIQNRPAVALLRTLYYNCLVNIQVSIFFFFFQAEDGIRDLTVTGVQTCALPISGHAGLLLVATVYCVFPIYFMFVQSLKTAQEDVFGNPFIVTNPTLENFEELFERKGQPRNFVGRALRRDYPFFVWLENTIVIFGGSVAITLAAGVAAAYAPGRPPPPRLTPPRSPC